MYSPYLKRIIIDICLAVALVLGVVYTYMVFLDFLISLFYFGYTVNLASLAYCIQRIILILLPLVMLTLWKSVPKIKLYKALFFIIGICYFVGNSWIFYYMAEYNPMDILYASIPQWFLKGDFLEKVMYAYSKVYRFQHDNAFAFNYIIWDSHNLFGVLFSCIQGYLYIDLALNVDGKRKDVVKKYAIINLVSLVVPLLYNLIVKARFGCTGDWITRNIILLFESLFIFMALRMASSSLNFWDDVMW